MKKRTLMYSTVLGSCIFFCAAESLEQKIAGWYKTSNGFLISAADKKIVEEHGGCSTYGEITYRGVQELIHALHLTEHDVFYDLGCGVGKMVAHIFLATPVKKSVGIELSPERTAQARAVHATIQKEIPISSERTFDFIQGDILTASLDDATVVYLASTCFSQEFMEKITQKLAKLSPGLRVITLKHLAPNPRFELVQTLQLPMTWSEKSTAYIYKLK